MTVLPFKACAKPPEFPVTRCRDISGPCCDQCHDQSDDMIEPLIGLRNMQGALVSLVCCLKVDEAGRRNKRPPEHKGGVLATPSAVCTRMDKA